MSTMRKISRKQKPKLYKCLIKSHMLISSGGFVFFLYFSLRFEAALVQSVASIVMSPRLKLSDT